MATFNRATYLATYIPHQQWSLPDSIIYYISKNASSAKIYGKLIQSCKYFLIRNPPIVVKNVELRQGNNLLAVYSDGKRVDLNTVPSKIWLTHEIYVTGFINSSGQNSLSAVIPKICQSNIKRLTFHNQICFINDLKFLGSKCENIEFINTLVMNKDGSVTAFQEVLQAFTHVARITFNFGNHGSKMVTPSTANELIKIPHFPNLQFFELLCIPESFDIDAFYAYLKKNRKTKFYFCFCDQISDGYRKRLQAVVDEIIAADSHDYKVPGIYFPNLNH